MDLSGQAHFASATTKPQAEPAEQGARAAGIGRQLLARAWFGLSSAQAESVDVHLRTGAQVAGVIALRVDGDIAEASTRAGAWTHAFPLELVAHVRLNPRGPR